MYYLLLLFVLVLTGCSSKEEKLRKQNLRGEYVYRLADEHFFTPIHPKPQTRETYPWEDTYIGGFPRITKEFLRCKGNPLNPVVIQTREKKESLYYRDCPGGKKHGLPLYEGKECVYTCLVELLNYIQEKTEHRVVITCGHRCPQHNGYSDYSPSNWGSKHMLGAEVDFYVEEMEEKPLEILALIQEYYLERPPFSQDKEFTQFVRYEKGGLNVSIPLWYNKEIFIKLYKEGEGRDFDNQHPYPYLGMQVRYDRVLNKRVVFEQIQAQNYLRH